MSKLQQQAAVFYHTLNAGLIEADEIVKWADQAILQAEVYPEALADISLNRTRISALSQALSELAEHPLSPEASALLCRTLLEHLARNPDDFCPVTGLLERLANSDELPAALQDEAYAFDDELNFAYQGIYDVQDVQRSVRIFLERFSSVSACSQRKQP